jgi:carbamoyl-phosphate synthase large subunit
MKILVTAIGSISAPFVIETIKNMNIEVIGVDIYPKEWVATSKEVGFFHQIPRVSQSEAYQNEILKLCNFYKVDMIIPLTDVEVDHYRNRVEEFLNKGVIVTISSENVINTLRNKLKVHETFLNSKIRVIPTYRQKEYMQNCNIFPCVAKKIMGRSSEGLLVLENENELKNVVLKDQDYILQPFIKGDIITVDILQVSGKKNIFYIARKELLRTKNGLGIAVEIIQDERISSILEQFGGIIAFKGCMNLEFIKNQSTYFLMDVNPRFSAGIAFSSIAGYNFVEGHISSFLGEKIENITKKHIKYGSIITRKYTEVLV